MAPDLLVGAPSSVEVMTSYVNPAEQLNELRTTLVRLAEAGTTDEPDLGGHLRH
jgi:hypothetical protein